MQCLVGYALRPSFLDPAFFAVIRIAKEKIHQLQFFVNEQLDISTKNNIDFDVSRTPEGSHLHRAPEPYQQALRRSQSKK